jgi:hypothetical protein
MDEERQIASGFWATLRLSCMTIVTLVFTVWDLVEHRFFRHFPYERMHLLYITRGIGNPLATC